MCGGQRQRVHDTGWVVVRPPIDRKCGIAILGANGEIVLAGVYFDSGLVEPLLRVGVLHGIYLDFITVPRGDVYGAVDIVELDSAIRRERVGLMKLLGDRASLVGRMRCQRKQE